MPMDVISETKTSAADILEQAADTYREKNKIYGNNFVRVAKACTAMFPDGITLKTEKDFSRFHFFLLGLVKKSRYATNWNSGGHQDSVRDETVYAAMLESEDANGP